MTDPPMVDDRDTDPTPGELEAQAERLRERAEEYEEVAKLHRKAMGALSTLAEHERVSERRQHHVQFVKEMLGLMGHSERWGERAYHERDHASRMEMQAEIKRRQEDAPDDIPDEAP